MSDTCHDKQFSASTQTEQKWSKIDKMLDYRRETALQGAL